MTLTIVVPTRNRASLARAAIGSVLDQGVPGVSVLVSDNSTLAAERRHLSQAVEAVSDPRVGYVAPREPLPMTAHWQWALEHALADDRTSHVLYLTDRMVLRRGWLDRLAAITRRYPTEVVSFQHDAVRDHTRPIRVSQQPWTGELLRVDSEHLAGLAREGEFPNSLPRMLNCAAPRVVLEEVAARFGSAFASISPDYCFAFRCLETVDAILYWDAAPLVHYALERSHGFSYAQGANTPDRQSFVADLDRTPMNACTPLPGFDVVNNAKFNEYFFVQSEPASHRLRPVPRHGYLAALAAGVNLVEDPIRREAMRGELARLGWRWRGARGRAQLRRLSLIAKFYAPRPGAFVRRVAALWQHGGPGAALLRRLVRRGIAPPPGDWLEFADQKAALRRAREAPPRKARDFAAIKSLVEPRSAATVIPGPATTPRSS